MDIASKTSIERQIEFREQHKDKLCHLLGTIPKGHRMVSRIRSHQGWWRAFVLVLPEGEYFDKNNKKWKRVCNRTFEETTDNRINYLTPEANLVAIKTVADRDQSNPGMIEETRLHCNLLSSQPLCFNFFGELMINVKFGLEVLQTWWPDLTELKRVIFEFAPKDRYTNDNSAFDIAFEVAIGNQIGLIGLECKYTDKFSSTEYDKPAYRDIYRSSESFDASYEDFVNRKYNQLFRNQLMAEALIQNSEYAFVRTGLFCYPGDDSAIQTAKELQRMLKNPDSFKIITYNSYIENVQELKLDWRQREWTMLLWARYCAMVLSNSTIKSISEHS